MKLSDLKSVGDGIYELKQGDGQDTTMIRIGCTRTCSNPTEEDFSVPCAGSGTLCIIGDSRYVRDSDINDQVELPIPQNMEAIRDMRMGQELLIVEKLPGQNAWNIYVIERVIWPWICTHLQCMKIFPNEKEWKRHEDTEYQPEIWRCNEANSQSKTGQCAELFYRRDSFKKHLQEDHQIEEIGYILEQCMECRIGRNGQTRYWCGLCQKTIELKKRGMEAWGERQDHVKVHLKKGETILNWYPPDSDIPKGKLSPKKYVRSPSPRPPSTSSHRLEPEVRETSLEEAIGSIALEQGSESAPSTAMQRRRTL